jgi:predicted metal-dependent hydrolase
VSEHGLVRYGNSEICYAVIRSGRRKKTIEITVDGAEGVLVAAPLAASSQDVRNVVLRRAGWILAKANWDTPAAQSKFFISGETLPYLGREVRMDVTHDDVPTVHIRFTHWAFDVQVPSTLDGEPRREAIRNAFKRWYRRRALDAVRKSAARWQIQLGVCPARVAVRDQRQRWGSCAPDGTLRFNWRIAMAEPSLLDYVVVHELAHLLHRNHSRDFWAEIERVMPDFRIRRQRLKEVGPRLSV